MLMEMWHTQKRYPRGETFYTQCTAVAVAVHCRSGCSALRPKPALSGVALPIFLKSL